MVGSCNRIGAAGIGEISPEMFDTIVTTGSQELLQASAKEACAKRGPCYKYKNGKCGLIGKYAGPQCQAALAVGAKWNRNTGTATFPDGTKKKYVYGQNAQDWLPARYRSSASGYQTPIGPAPLPDYSAPSAPVAAESGMGVGTVVVIGAVLLGAFLLFKK